MPKRVPRWIRANWFVLWHITVTILLTVAFYAIWGVIQDTRHNTIQTNKLAKQNARNAKIRVEDSIAARKVICRLNNSRNTFDRRRISRTIRESESFLIEHPNGISGISDELIQRGIDQNKKDLKDLPILPCKEFAQHPEQFLPKERK